ncbi:winged helix DNA-binding domain-containing protein [Nakamurella leprariae]|uniref:AlkZ family DNA glycosylase n=1 Tax=Nakamurella leprariae TaxID=2803911 RepID=A0A938YKB7_9ACTN|nr:winged helix DNA-binding domain-containing protein [Nakamurella leprariae]MBM9469370.1 AlkZ family DNA glycosylase [Nakamurella leprariae]
MTALTDRELNRALLARQGLLAPFDADVPIAEVVRRTGALQSQQWTTVPIGLWARTSGFDPAAVWAALDAGDLITGTLLRGTLHVVDAQEYPAYAAHAAAHLPLARAKGTDPAGLERLAADLVTACRGTVMSADATRDFADAWVAEHPDEIDAAELEQQQASRWRNLRAHPRLVRVPERGGYGSKTPSHFAAAPRRAALPAETAALEVLVRAHLRAFGPAAPADVASWLGTRVSTVQRVVDGADDLEVLAGPGRGSLVDLVDAPRPDGDVEVPARFLPAFDNVILAYDASRRGRIVRSEDGPRIWGGRNLRIDPLVLIDGMAAGKWSSAASRSLATVTVQPFQRVPAAARRAVEAAAVSLTALLHPRAADTRVQWSTP